MNEEELAGVLDAVNKEIEKEDKKRYVVYGESGGRFFSMNCPEKEEWLQGIRKNEQKKT